MPASFADGVLRQLLEKVLPIWDRKQLFALGVDNHLFIFAAKARHFPKGRRGDGPPVRLGKVLAMAGII